MVSGFLVLAGCHLALWFLATRNQTIQPPMAARVATIKPAMVIGDQGVDCGEASDEGDVATSVWKLKVGEESQSGTMHCTLQKYGVL